VTWSVENTAVAVVTSSGQLTAVKTGDTTALATLGAVVASAPVTVSP
jgi:Bacterial Ig-like domain (group 2)